MKAQAAMEYFTIVVVGLIIITPMIIYLNDMYLSYSDDNKISLAKITVNKIADSANWVFSQGPPAKVKIEVFIPDNVESISFANNTVNFAVRTKSGVVDVYDTTIMPIYGNLNTKSGYYFISLVAYDNYVNISVV